ncbi:3-hydroxybutyryl-CoA dehydrogenase [Chromatiales bacterium (ex Bugula neritina AB1)]|nr:3-hydroxybutyryl-CoA dehydrogenase [Chromatiales bacterium (ex Bugula neritina AB1)]
MGRSIAVAFCLAGIKSTLIDLKPRSVTDRLDFRQQALSEVRTTLVTLATLGMIAPEDIDSHTELLSYSDSEDAATAFSGCHMVFEGVPETLEAKAAALTTICQHCPVDALIASTTSTILSDDLQALVTHPERFLNAHWLNPAYLVPLVELSPASKTAPETTASLKRLLEAMGKVPIVCKASPGYVVPRMQMLAMNEAARMVEEGVASVEDIDKASKYGFGFRFAILGMLEFIDWGGGDILYHAGNYMTEATGEERYVAPEIINENMKNNRIGLRTGQGFLDYANMDIPSYKQQKLAEFVAMLNHLDVMPKKAT